jgi:hypothetical protein
MRRALGRACLALATLAGASGAQDWNTPTARALAERAVTRRTTQLTDTTLLGYRAQATGYLTFLAQVGDTALLPPKVIKQDQIAVRIFWAPPASSKQIVVGLRDTALLPSDIGYYRDRYGIVQSNFPDRIRMGDGKDIADVLHPFAATGLTAYDFAVTDSISITTPQAKIDVHRVAFRPRDPTQPRAIGSAYLDIRTGDIVRLELAFTRAAILDDRIEHLAVVLDNALIEGRYWLPNAQQIEVQRAADWLSIEVRGIIRGRWEVCCYEVDLRFPVDTFYGPAISFLPPDSLRAYPFQGNILDALPPGAAAVRSEDVERATAMATALVQRALVERTQQFALAIPRASEILRVNRAEGLAVGMAAKAPLPGRFVLDARGRYGFSDARWKAELGVSTSLGAGRSLRVFAREDFAEVRDVAEVSGLRNSLAAGLFGTDLTDPIGVRAAGAELVLGRLAGVRWRMHVAGESHRALTREAAPWRGSYERLVPAREDEGVTGTLIADGALVPLAGGTLTAAAALRVFDLGGRGLRASGSAEHTRRASRGQLMMRTTFAAVSGGDVAPQFMAVLGGPTTTPGYESYDFTARRAVTQRIEWSTPVPFVPIPLGKYGALPGEATLIPFAHTVWMDGVGRQGWYPSVGVGFEPFLGMARFDVARGLRDGRWTFSFDVMRGWWGIL